VQPQRLHLDVGEHLQQAVGQAGVVPLLGVDMGMHVGHDLEGLAEERVDLVRPAASVRRPRRQDCLDPAGELLALRGVHNPLAVQPGSGYPFDGMADSGGCWSRSSSGRPA